MKLLSSHDELLMLVILELGENAYGVPIRKELSRATGKEWSIGAVYDPLYRLENRGLVESFLSEPTSDRGGRSKRIFLLTPKGREALLSHKKVRDHLWGRVKGTAGILS